MIVGDKTYVLGTKYYKAKDTSISYFLCEDEKDLLTKFLQLWSFVDLDIVSGWSINGFDIPYLYTRIGKVLGDKDAKRLSPWGIVTEKETQWAAGKTRKEYTLNGIQILDYLELYKKFTFTNHESYALDHISHVELGEKKIDYSEYQSLNELFNKDYEKFIDYNILDAQLVKKLDEKLGFLNQILFFAYDAKVNYIDTLGTVNVWDVIITNYLLEQKIAVPQNVTNQKEFSIVGGYVKEPYIGLSKWVMNYDFTSLYPKLIISQNISNDTFIKKLDIAKYEQGFKDLTSAIQYAQNHNYSATAYGCMYSREKQGFFPALMEKMFQDRQDARALMGKKKKEYQDNPSPELANEISHLNNKQLARKIQLNSGYGAMANRYFRFFNSDIAESVTSTGQLAIQFVEKKINEYFNKVLKTKNVDYVVASDTDSLYITFEKLIDRIFPDGGSIEEKTEFLSRLSEREIEPFIARSIEEFTTMMNSYKNQLVMKREVIADRSIWRGAKMYIMNVRDKEGLRLKEPETLMHGIEAVRSSTPMVCREAIKKTLKIILNGTESELHKFISEFREKFYDLPYEDIASPRSVNGLDLYADANSIYKTGSPIQVKGALIYNHFLKEKGLDNKYELIYSGNKVKYCYLTLPNPVKCNVIATPGRMPKELGLDKYLNRDLQFSKSFLNPVQSLVELIGWNTSKSSSLEAFFG